MMNVLEIQNDLKNFSEEQLIKEMQQPSGSAPQFLVLSELNRRKRVKGEFEARQAKNMPTVAEEAVAAAGVPQAGMMGMSEAMAPASVESGGIGSMMPKTMKMGGEVDSYAEGGLIEGIADNVNQNAEALQQLTQSQAETSKLLQDQQNKSVAQTPSTPPLPSVATTMPTRPFPMPRPPFGGGIAGMGGKGGPRTPQRPFNRMPMNRFGVPPQQNLGTMAARLGTGGLGFGQYARRAFGIAEPQSMAEGGVIRAQSGKFFDAMGRPTQELINAMIMQESGGKTKARGSLDEVGLAQIRPSTAIKPGYGVKSMFPELESQIGKGKKYATANEAYADNKEMVDARLEEGDTSANFMKDLLTGYRKNIDTDAGAISAYNVGPTGLKNIKNPAEFKYFTEVASKMKPVEYDETPMKSGIMSAEAATQNKSKSNTNQTSANVTDAEIEEYIKKTKPEALAAADRYEPPLPKSLESMMIRGGQRSLVDDPRAFDLQLDLAKDLNLEDLGTIAKKKEKFGSTMQANIAAGNIAEKLAKENEIKKEEQKKIEDEKKAEEKKKLEKPKPEEPKTQLTTLEQELLNRQKQLQKDRDFDRYMALAQAGLSIMSSDKPTLAGAIGEGGTAGLTAFREAQERYQEGLNDILNARVKLASKKGGLTQKEAINAISAIDSNIATLRGKMASATDPAIIKEIQDEIAQFNFQKESLMPRAGFSRLSMNVSDSAAK